MPKLPSAPSVPVPKPPALPSANTIKSQAPRCLGLHHDDLSWLSNGLYTVFLIFFLVVLFLVDNVSQPFAEGQVLIYK